MEVLLEVVLVLLLVFLNGFFVCAEYAAVKLRSAQLTDLLAKKDPRARLAKSVIDRLDSFLSATQLGVTFASLALGWVGEPLTTRLMEPLFSLFGLTPTIEHTLSFIIGFLILTAVHIVFGEQVPKALAINYELEVSLVAARPLTIYYQIFRPLIWVLNVLVRGALKMFGFPSASEDEGHTKEELRSVIMESARRGVVERRESNIIDSIFDFDQTTTKEIMVHRSEMIAIDIDMEPREILRRIENEGFSRLPVWKDTVDQITGILYVRELLPYISNLERLSVPSQHQEKEFITLLNKAIRPALFVSETQTISKLMLAFQKNRMHLAVVVSEHGGVEGIVTLEDILEELVGEIHDETDENEAPDVIEINGGVYIDPTMTVSEFNARFKGRFPELEESAEYATMSGFVQKEAGRIPNIGDVVESGGLQFTVTRKVRHRLEQIKVEMTVDALRLAEELRTEEEEAA